MKILIIFAHPSEKSFCAALRDKYIQGLKQNENDFIVHNLYQMNFNPIITSQEHYGEFSTIQNNQSIKKLQNDIEWADIITLIYPVYWYSVPAILKGYFDRLLTKGFAYEYEIDHPIPLLTKKKGIIIQTFDAEEELEKSLFEDVSYKSVQFTWKYCGITDWTRKAMFRVNFVAKGIREKWLEEIFTLGAQLK